MPPAGQTPPAAQTPAAGQSPQATFRARIDSVSVDVAVTDKQGKPVSDLTAADFEIRESSRLQTVDTFKFIKIDDATDPNAAPVHEIRSLEDQVREAAREDNRLFVIFLDDYHVRKGNGLRARQQLANFVSTLGPRDLVGVMYPSMPLTALDFTRDHDATVQAILHFEGRKYDYTPRNGFESRMDYLPPEAAEQIRNDVTLTALRGLCTYLGTLRDGRKTVLFFSEGLAGTLPAGVNTKGGRNPPSGTSREQSFANSMELLDGLQQVYKAAARGNASVYTLDPRGLAGEEFQIDDMVMGDADKQVMHEAGDSLHTLADQTGGRAIMNRNDPAPELRQMLRDTSAYYLLSFTSSVAPRDGKFHEISVRVKRKDVDVRARKGYWAYSADDVAKMSGPSTPKPGPPPEVDEALAAISDQSRGHSMNFWLGANRGPAGKGGVTLVWEGAAGVDGGQAPGADAVDHVVITARAVSGGQVIFTGLAPRDPQATRAMGRVSFDAPPGELHVQVSGENARGQRVDRSERAVDVPDFTAPGPLVTTPIVYRGRTARDIQQIRAATDPTPAVTREFSRTERLLVRFEAFGPAGSAPTMSMRLLNQLGQSMATLPAPVRTTGAGYESEIGLGSLPPGEYLIEISAEASTGTVKTLLAIRVTG
jgi:VWFA-related protein